MYQQDVEKKCPKCTQSPSRAAQLNETGEDYAKINPSRRKLQCVTSIRSKNFRISSTSSKSVDCENQVRKQLTV